MLLLDLNQLSDSCKAQLTDVADAQMISRQLTIRWHWAKDISTQKSCTIDEVTTE